MPAPQGAYVMRNSSITLNGTQYANQITSARLVPDVPIQTVRTLVPDGHIVDIDNPVWTFELSAASIWVTGGLAYALHELTGEEVDVVLEPAEGSNLDKVEFTIRALPVSYGGGQGAVPLFEASFPVVGTPVFSPSGA